MRNYSPVPHWDMWDGYIAFYQRVSDGDWRAWWVGHNEHRMVFSRIVFWLDIRFFHGLSLLLIPLNLLLMGLLWAALALGAHRLFKDLPQESMMPAMAALLAVVCFSWMQKDNITWGFQNAFFAAYLFPILAFQCLALSVSGPKSKLWFVGAVAFGAVSVGTMANGVFALPLMAAMAVMLRQSKTRILILVVASIGELLMYNHALAPSSLTGVSADPGRIIMFLLVYLGSPLAVILNDTVIAMFGGLVFIACSILCFSRWLQSRVTDPMFLAFVTFLAYIGCTALATAIGRTDAVASRYMTPVLLGWAVLSVLLVFEFHAHPKFAGVASAAAVFIPLLLLPSQLNAIRVDPTESNHRRLIAALALDLGVRDKVVVEATYPFEGVYAIASEAKRRGLSVFALPAFSNARSYLHQQIDALPLRDCLGHIDTRAAIGGDGAVSRVSGWAFDAKQRTIPAEVFFVDASNEVVGVGLTGFPRPDVAHGIDGKAGLSGFDGYVFADKTDLRFACPS
jgi:hypothetical protein